MLKPVRRLRRLDDVEPLPNLRRHQKLRIQIVSAQDGAVSPEGAPAPCGDRIDPLQMTKKTSAHTKRTNRGGGQMRCVCVCVCLWHIDKMCLVCAGLAWAPSKAARRLRGSRLSATQSSAPISSSAAARGELGFRVSARTRYSPLASASRQKAMPSRASHRTDATRGGTPRGATPRGACKALSKGRRLSSIGVAARPE